MPKVSRRTFIKLMGSSGAYLVSGSDLLADSKHVKPVPAGWYRGEERYVNSTCLQCPAGCGIRVRVYEGRAVKIDGNIDHPLNRGRLCPKGQSGLQVLYDPDRIRGPMRKIGGRESKKYEYISWDDAISEVADKLKNLREQSKSHSVLMMSGRDPESTKVLFNRFASAYGTPNKVDTYSLSDGIIKLGNECAMGVFDHLGFNLENTNYLICFGASFLEAWRPTTYLLRMYGKMKRGRVGRRAKVVIVDPRYSVGASKVDEWISIRPGTDGALAMGIAHVIISEGLYHKQFVSEHCFGFEEWNETPDGKKHKGFKDVVAKYDPERVEKITEVPASTIVRIAREFASSTPAVAAAGRGAGLHTNGLFNGLAVNALNALVGSIDIPGGVIVQRKPPLTEPKKVILDEQAQKTKSTPSFDISGSEDFPLSKNAHFSLLKNLLKNDISPIEMALIYYTNPLFSGPDSNRYRKALGKIPFIVSFSPFMDETTEYADIILPDHTFLERLEYDFISPSLGYPVLNLRQPVMKPLYDTRNTGEVLIGLAHKIGGTLKENFPWNSYEAFLKASISGVAGLQNGSFKSRNENDYWKTLKEKGVWFGEPYRFGEWEKIFQTPSGKYEFFSQIMQKHFDEFAQKKGKTTDSILADMGLSSPIDEVFMPHFETLKFAGDFKEYPFYLNTFKTMMHAEGRGGNQPWLQDSFGVQLIMRWEPWASINPDSAHELGIKDEDMVWIESPIGRIKIRAKLYAGISKNIVFMPFEYGHNSYGRWAENIKGNPNQIISSEIIEPIGGFNAVNATRVKVYKE